MVEKSQDIEMDKSVAVGNVENNSEKVLVIVASGPSGYLMTLNRRLTPWYVRRELSRKDRTLTVLSQICPKIQIYKS